MHILQTLLLFCVTAILGIVGCYLSYLWLQRGAPAWLLAPAAPALTAFPWLLTLHPAAAGRTYVAYGGVYVAVAIVWLWKVVGIRPDRSDLIGSAVAPVGMALIMFGNRS